MALRWTPTLQVVGTLIISSTYSIILVCPAYYTVMNYGSASIFVMDSPLITHQQWRMGKERASKQRPWINIQISTHCYLTGGNRAKLPSSRWRRRGRSLREVFACSRIFGTTDLSQICNRVTRGHVTPCTKTTDSYPFSFLYNNHRKNDDGSLRYDDGSKRLGRLENVYFHSNK